MEMNFVLILKWFLTIGLVRICHSRVAIIIRIYNYANENDITHTGVKCESFHFFNDYCDPMFSICVTSRKSCDILSHVIDHWKNKKYLTNVMYKTVKVNDIKRSFALSVRVDDHDKMDGHDHVAVFNANFEIDVLNKIYAKAMTVSPIGLNVLMYASMSMRCDDHYYGKDCDIKCVPLQFNYECNQTTGETICAIDCGINGICEWNSKDSKYACKCNPGWTGDQCLFSNFMSCDKLNCDLNCTYSQLYRYCTCKSNPNSKICQEAIIMTEKSIKPTVVSSTIKQASTITTTGNMKNHTATRTTIRIHNKYGKSTDENIKDYTQKAIILQSSYSPTTIAIICILIILCMCVITLLFVIRRWRKTDKINNNGFFKHALRSQMPLPPVVYKPDLYTNKVSGSVYKDSALPVSPRGQDDLCTIQSDCRSEVPLIRFECDYYKIDDDAYEVPTYNNTNSNTCEIEINDGDNDSAEYEVPR